MAEKAPTPKPVVPPLQKTRVISLDALRGFDLFLLCGFTSIYGALMNGPLSRFTEGSKFWETMNYQICEHSDWEGFTLHDLIMPLFMFMSGVTICFSMAKYKKSEENPSPSRFRFWCRLIRRILLLWIFGMIAQGNLLNLRWDGLRLYSHTLQAIAAGYIVAVACYFLMKKWGQVVVAAILMFVFWGAMTWIKAGDCGGGSFDKWTNLAELIDRTVLGRWMDGVSFADDGSWSFSENYHYTWILSSLTFGVTAILGLIGGEIIKYRSNSEKSGHLTSLILIGIGAICAAAGWYWGMVPEGTFGYCPLIKHLWTPSMTLYSGGVCYILLGVFHEIYDVLHIPLLKTFLLVIGTNSILIYMLPHFVNFTAIAGNITHGLEHHIGEWYRPLPPILGFIFTWLFLWTLYKHKKFLRL